MKHLKLFIASLFLMLGMAVHAQQVEITKTDGTVEVFKPNEVDSVVYKPAPKFYYYAGWECPKNEEELAELIKTVDKNGTTMGGQFESLEGLDINKNYYPNPVYGPYDKWYIVIPSTLNCYDYYSGGKMTDDKLMFKKINVIGNHSVWQSTDDNKTDEYYNLKIY